VTTSLFDDQPLKDDYCKKINKAKAIMAAMDKLPERLRLALKGSCTDFDAEWIADLLKKKWSEDSILLALAAAQPESLEPEYDLEEEEGEDD
jgi:hypothetical protein